MIQHPTFAARRGSLLIGLISALLLLFLSAGNAIAKTEFIWLDQIKPGMKAVAKTVIQGAKVESFNGLVIAKVDKAEFLGFNDWGFMIVRFDDELTNRTNGIVGGMSGSPVFINGKLAGAISGHWLQTDSKNAIVTPIGEMLKAFNQNDPRFNPFDSGPGGDLEGLLNPLTEMTEGAEPPTVLTLRHPKEIDGRRVSRFIFTDGSVGQFFPGYSSDKETIVARYTAPPLFASGIAEEDLKYFNYLDGSVEVAALGGDRYPPYVKSPKEFEPGSVLGLILCEGDLRFFTYGTLTYIDKNGNFLAFGHRMHRKGYVNLIAANGYIYGVPPNLRRADKIGVALDSLGTVYQDIGSAIAGAMGNTPEMITFKVRGTLLNSGETKEITFELPKDSFHIELLLPGILDSSFSFLNRKAGEGTVTLDWAVSIPNRDEPIFRSNRYYTQAIPGGLSGELVSLISLLLDNPFSQMFPEKVDVNATFTSDRRTVRINRIKLLSEDEAKELKYDGENTSNGTDLFQKTDVTGSDGKETLHPPAKPLAFKDGAFEIRFGSTLIVLSEFQPYRGNLFYRAYKLYIPQPRDAQEGKGVLPPGKYQLQVRGAGNIVPPASDLPPDVIQDYFRTLTSIRDYRYKPSFTNLDEMIEEIRGAPVNGDLVVEIVFTDDREKAGVKEKEDLPHLSKEVHIGDVVLGTQTLPVRLVKEK